jgi:hypothetical protein
MEEQPDSDAQPVEIEEQPQEEQPQEEQPQQEPIRDVETFWTRLDDVLQHLESQPQPGTKPVRSFIYQPELLSINSQDDIGTETENSANPFFFNTFTVRLVKPCLNVKGLQLLRCSFPTPVTNLPNEECAFWYYRFPKYLNDGTYFNAGTLVIDPTDGNFYIAKTSVQYITPHNNPINWAPVGTVAPNTGTTGAITRIAPTYSLTFTSITTTAPYYVYYYTTTSPSVISAGQNFTVSGATSAGFNGTFSCYGTIGSGPGTWAVVCTNPLQIPPGVSSGGSIVSGGTTYTATSTTGLYVGLPVTVTGATTSAYNGTFNTITAVTSTSFTISNGLSGASSTATWTAASVTQPYLYMIRLQPSWLPPELIGTQYAYNRTFTDYGDLVAELNKACAADPLGSPYTEPSSTFKYLANDISFSYNQTYNKIAMTGASAAQFYLPAGYSDPNIFNINNANAAEALLQLYTTETILTGAFPYAIGGYAGQGQPYTPNRTLNMRLGWTWNGNIGNIANYKNQFRPVPYYAFDYINSGLPIAATVLSTLINNAPSYANLVNTATVIVFLDVVGGSTQDSTGAGGVLGSVPLSTQNNGVGFFDKVLSHKLTKIPSQLQELRFTLKDEQGNPFLLPNSAVVNLEIGVEY